MKREPVTIDHNPNEKREPWWLWWAGFAGLALIWSLFIDDEMNWEQIMLGIGTGGIITAWAMDMTGGEVPASWRSKTPRRKR